MARFTVHSWHQQMFDATTTPPSPVLSLQIAGPEADDWIAVSTALVDTGVDATIVPDALLSQILAVEWDQARLRSQWESSGWFTGMKLIFGLVTAPSQASLWLRMIWARRSF